MSPPAQFSDLAGVKLPPRPLHLAIGMFDGVHLGHQAVIEPAVHSARRCEGLAGVLTFWPHPSVVFKAAARVRMLMNPQMKARVLLRLGVDVVIEQPFTLAFARIAAEEFLPHLQRHLPHLAGVYVGENWRFGAGRKGDVKLLLAEAAKHQVPVVSVPRISVQRRADQQHADPRLPGGGQAGGGQHAPGLLLLRRRRGGSRSAPREHSSVFPPSMCRGNRSCSRGTASMP